MEKVTFTFTGSNAKRVAERFKAYFWDGGFDQYIEQEFLNRYGLDLDDVTMDEEKNICINTDHKTED